MRVALSGSSGLIGSAIGRDLRKDKHDVTRLVRREPRAADEVRWDPYSAVDSEALEGIDAVVHFAGAGIGDRRWSQAYKKEIYNSRVEGTHTLCAALAGMRRKPAVLLSGSGITIYGDVPEGDVDESAPVGGSFLADLARDWEAATGPAKDAGIRVVNVRTGLVLAREAPFVKKGLPLFKLGLGGRLGSGRHWLSWVSLTDHVAAMRFLLDHDIAGPVNVNAPNPVTNAEYTKALGRAVRRPAPFPVPRLALRLAIGEFTDEVLSGQRAVPRRLTEAGFEFRHPDIEAAFSSVFSKLDATARP